MIFQILLDTIVAGGIYDHEVNVYMKDEDGNLALHLPFVYPISATGESDEVKEKTTSCLNQLFSHYCRVLRGQYIIDYPGHGVSHT